MSACFAKLEILFRQHGLGDVCTSTVGSRETIKPCLHSAVELLGDLCPTPTLNRFEKGCVEIVGDPTKSRLEWYDTSCLLNVEHQLYYCSQTQSRSTKFHQPRVILAIFGYLFTVICAHGTGTPITHKRSMYRRRKAVPNSIIVSQDTPD